MLPALRNIANAQDELPAASRTSAFALSDAARCEAIPLPARPVRREMGALFLDAGKPMPIHFVASESCGTVFST
jgi:hypothetical protein